MALYQNLEELNGHTLRINDHIKIGDMTLEVKEDHLHKCEDSTSQTIYGLLGIKNPWEFCSKAFFYIVEWRKGDTYPKYKLKDFTAVTCLARALFEKYEEMQKELRAIPPLAFP